MATQLFKDGESAWVDTRRVQQHLQAGWSPHNPATPVSHPDVIYPAGMNLESLPVHEAEAAILKEMGIVTVDGVSTGFTPISEVRPIETVQAPELKPKRKYTRRK